jgi:hypothetical protein
MPLVEPLLKTPLSPRPPRPLLPRPDPLPHPQPQPDQPDEIFRS